MERFSNVFIRETDQSQKIMITGDTKPEIIGQVLDKWQSLIDTLAKIVEVPSGLIMRLNEKDIEVFIKSNTKGNPYEKGYFIELVSFHSKISQLFIFWNSQTISKNSHEFPQFSCQSN